MNHAHAQSPVTVYSGQTTNWSAIALLTGSSFLLLVGSLASWDISAMIAVTLILVGTAADILMTTSLRVTIGSHGLSIRAGTFGWPRFSCALDQIERIEAVDLGVLSWGLGVWWVPGGNVRFTLRSGPAIRVHLMNGRKVTVNVEDVDAAISTFESARS